MTHFLLTKIAEARLTEAGGMKGGKSGRFGLLPGVMDRSIGGSGGGGGDSHELDSRPPSEEKCQG